MNNMRVVFCMKCKSLNQLLLKAHSKEQLNMPIHTIISRQAGRNEQQASTTHRHG